MVVALLDCQPNGRRDDPDILPEAHEADQRKGGQLDHCRHPSKLGRRKQDGDVGKYC
jgi:hypothetical protein